MNPTRYPSEMRFWTGEDLKLIEKLCHKYGRQEVMLVVRGLPEQTNDPSRLSVSTLSSNRSIDSILYTSSEGSGGLSRAGSVTGSILSHPSTRSSLVEVSTPCTPDALREKPLRSFRSKQLLAAEDGTPASSPLPVDSPRPSVASSNYWCPLCQEPVGFARKADCKRHILRHHCSSTVWKCNADDCAELFDSKKNYLIHAKEKHNIPKPQADEHQVELSPRKVFACGFENCKEKVFEAADEDMTSKTGDKYADHVSKHYDDGARPGNWRYTVELRNLLLQSRLKERWKMIISKETRNQLSWDPSSASYLKHHLEWRQWDNIDDILRAAIALSSSKLSNLPKDTRSLLEDAIPLHGQSNVEMLPTNQTDIVATKMVQNIAIHENNQDKVAEAGHSLNDQYFLPVGNGNNINWEGNNVGAWQPPPPYSALHLSSTNSQHFDGSFFTRNHPTQMHNNELLHGTDAGVSQVHGGAGTQPRPYDDIAALEAAKMLRAGLVSKNSRAFPHRWQDHQTVVRARPVSVVMEDPPELDFEYAAYPSYPPPPAKLPFADEPGNWGSLPSTATQFLGNEEGHNFI